MELILQRGACLMKANSLTSEQFPLEPLVLSVDGEKVYAIVGDGDDTPVTFTVKEVEDNYQIVDVMEEMDMQEYGLHCRTLGESI